MTAREPVFKDETITSRLRALYGRYGYSQFRMRKFEEYDLYVRNKSFLISDHVITFTEPSGKLMALKPDVTLSIVKNSKETPGYVQKVYYKESVYRVDKDSDTFKEITQVGLECVGDIDDYSIFEVLLLAVESLREIGEEFVLDISHLGIVSAVLDEAGVAAAYRAPILRCIGEKNSHGVAALCREAGVDETKIAAIVKLVTTYGERQRVLAVLEEMSLGESGRAALAQLRCVLTALEKEAPAGSIRVDFSVIHDMNYYNGIVFRGFLYGIPSGILSGGQYDYLMQKMGKNGGAIGFAVYPDLLERLASPQQKYDVDTVLLYDEALPLADVRAAARALAADGKSVTVQKSLPGKLRYRQLCRLNESGVEILEEHA
ncbi:MAG: ATP phosphoribosyltransferase regulatory subunit [Clostridia bacterium]|nr:ATP phosphoribosyltransferase regulatory subunit [Clostridia bacterium]